MTLSIAHQFVSAIADSADATLVQPSNWNASHAISGLAAGIQTFLENATPLQLGAAQTLTVLPIGNAGISTLSSLSMHGAAISNTTREFLSDLGFTVATGHGAAGNGKDKVTQYVSVSADTNAGNVWATNILVELKSSLSNAISAQAIEVDFNNSYADYTSLSPVAAGLALSGAGTKLASTAIYITGTTSNDGVHPIWTMGIAMTGPSIRDFSILDQTNSVYAHLIQGSHAQGIDMTGATISGSALGLASGHLISWNGDTFITRDAANTLALRNSTNAQTFRVYQTFTDASNYQRFSVGWDGSGAILAYQFAGTGSPQSFRINSNGAMLNVGSSGGFVFGSDAANWWNINSSGMLLASTDNTYDIGASGANRPRDVNVARNAVVAGTIYMGPNASVFQSPSDGVFTMANDAGTSFGRLQFGGTTSSFPALKRNGAQIDVRLADDSGYAAITTSSAQAISNLAIGSGANAPLLTPGTNVLQIAPAGGPGAMLIAIGGSSSSFPGIKRSNEIAICRLGDDSADTGFQAAYYRGSAPNTQSGTSYSMVAADSDLIFTNAGAVTLTLLAASSHTGRILFVKQTGAGAVSSASSNVVPIGGGSAGTAITTASGKWARLKSDGSSWIIMASN